MNQDKQSEVIERVVAILKRRMFINDLGAADGGPEEFRMQGHERAAREIVTALSRPSLSTPSGGVIERQDFAKLLSDWAALCSDPKFPHYHVTIAELLREASARLSPLPLVEDES